MSQLRIRHVSFTAELLVTELQDGRTIMVPLSWFPKLLGATQKQREAWELISKGRGIRWSEIDEDISLRGLLSETAQSLGPQ